MSNGQRCNQRREEAKPELAHAPQRWYSHGDDSHYYIPPRFQVGILQQWALWRDAWDCVGTRSIRPAERVQRRKLEGSKESLCGLRKRRPISLGLRSAVLFNRPRFHLYPTNAWIVALVARHRRRQFPLSGVLFPLRGAPGVRKDPLNLPVSVLQRSHHLPVRGATQLADLLSTAGKTHCPLATERRSFARARLTRKREHEEEEATAWATAPPMR